MYAIRSYYEEMKCVFLDRKDIRQSYECLESSVNLLKGDYSLIIFPEGKLNEGKEIAEFRNNFV